MLAEPCGLMRVREGQKKGWADVGVDTVSVHLYVWVRWLSVARWFSG